MERIREAFRTEVREMGRTAVIELYGEIDAQADVALSAAFEEAVHYGRRAVLLNFDQVSYINSTGIALIVGLLAQARRDHISLLTCGLTDHYQEIFHITRLSDFMTMFPDEASALAQ